MNFEKLEVLFKATLVVVSLSHSIHVKARNIISVLQMKHLYNCFVKERGELSIPKSSHDYDAWLASRALEEINRNQTFICAL